MAGTDRMEKERKCPSRFRLKKRIAPGVWEDQNGAMHISIPELLKFFNIADTPENRDQMVRVAHEVIRVKVPNCRIVENL
jgi:hypothetical protein